MRKFLFTLFASLIVSFIPSVGVSQTFVAGGFEAGGNNVRFRDRAEVDEMVFNKGQKIDSYGFWGGWFEGKYHFYDVGRVSVNARALGDLTTDPKYLGPDVGRDGARFHIRPELEAVVPVRGEWSAVAGGGIGFTHVWNNQFGKSGINPHIFAGVEYDEKYRFTATKLFQDTTHLNDNDTEGYRLGVDVLQPINPKWAVRSGFEFTRYYNQIPGLMDEYSPYHCNCVRTTGRAVVFRIGIARVFPN